MILTLWSCHHVLCELKWCIALSRVLKATQMCSQQCVNSGPQRRQWLYFRKKDYLFMWHARHCLCTLWAKGKYSCVKICHICLGINKQREHLSVHTFYKGKLFFIFKLIIYFNWKIIILQYCGIFLPYINMVHMCPMLFFSCAFFHTLKKGKLLF